MKRFLLFTLVNTAILHTVSSFNPNIFWKHAKTMTKNIGSNVYRKTKTAIIPIVAKIKNTNGGFYEGNSNNNYLQSNSRYSNPQQMTNQQQHVSDGLYQDYRRSLTETQYYTPVLAPVYMQPASAPVYTLTPQSPTPPVPAPTSLYAPPPSAYTTSTQAPPSSVSGTTALQSNNALAMSRYAHAPVPVAPASTVEKKEYSTEGLYEEYRKSLQKTNHVTENTDSLNTKSLNTGRSSQNTATGFYSGPNKSSNVKEDTKLYEPPRVVKSQSHISGHGFYQGR